MDKRIWKKDDFFEIGGKRIDMDPEVVDISEKSVPLCWNFGYEEPLGHAVNIQLIEGEIVGDLEFFDEHHEEHFEALKDDVRLGGHYHNIQYKDENKTEVGSCKLVGVSFVALSSMPGYDR